MRKNVCLLSLALCLVLPPVASPQPALPGPLELSNLVRERANERAAGVDNYTLIQTMAGTAAMLYFERLSVDTELGNIISHRMLGPAELALREQEGNPLASSETLLSTGLELMQLGPRIRSEMGLGGFGDLGPLGGLLGGLMGGLGDTGIGMLLDPAAMVEGMGFFMFAAGMGARDAENAEGDARRDVRQDGNAISQLSANAEVIGIEQVEGRSAYVMRVPNMDQTQRVDGQEFTLQTASIWIDTEEYVQLQMKIEGTVTAEGQTRPITIERYDTDHRNVGTLYMPFRQQMRMCGMMGAAGEAEMRELQQQRADFERQMADLERQIQSMPEAQQRMMRQMMEERLAPQMEMLRNMGGDCIEMPTEIRDVRINAGMPSQMEMASTMFGMPMPMEGVRSACAQAETRPYYVDEEGIGVLRFSHPAGSTADYLLAIHRLAGGQPGEVLADAMGPYPGPNVAVYLGSVNAMRVPLDQLELELYEPGPPRCAAARFRPELNASRAEGMAQCGTVSSTGACSNTRPGN